MKIFGLDTTKKIARIFIVDSEKNDICMCELGENIKHSECLFLYIEKILLENKLDIADFDCFACVVGPGSFTGIRVGMSTIKGFNIALKKSIVSLNSFDILKSEIKSGLIVLNSTSTACYYAKIKKNEIIETGVVEKSKIVELAGGDEVLLLQEEQKYINLEYNNCVVISDLKNLYKNAILTKLNTGDYGEFLPYYLQLSQAERNLKDVGRD